MAIVPPALASRRAVTSATAVSAFWLVVVSIPLVAFRSTMVVASHQFFNLRFLTILFFLSTSNRVRHRRVASRPAVTLSVAVAALKI